jgi:hypothetical protein
MRARAPIPAALALAGFVGLVACVVETTPQQTGRPNPNTGSGGALAGTGGTSGVPGSGGTGDPGTAGTGDPGSGGSDPGAGGTPSATGGTGTGAGGTTGGSASGSGGGTAVCGGASSPDPNCTTSLAKTDATCTVDCCVACGFNALGTKTCTCDGTVFTACPCAPPPDWQAGGTADACTSVIGNDGLVETNDETPCTTEWEKCIAADPPSGTTPRGCVCLPDPKAGGALRWSCGSTNKWFTCPAGATHSGCPPPA